MNYDMSKSGKRIRKLRIQKHLTQETVAEALNIDRSFYGRIETGQKGCSIDLFVQLSELFDASLDYLVLGKYPGAVPKSTDKVQLKKSIDELTNQLEQFKAIL